MKKGPKRVAITGASGLVGRAVCEALAAREVEVLRLVRSVGASSAHDAAYWSPAEGELDLVALEAFAPEAVIHLAGENIGGQRWTDAFKSRVLRSRVDGTRLISESVAKLSVAPEVFISASATGYYGGRGDEWVDEQSAPGSGFLAEVCTAWEAAAQPARAAGVRVVHPRFGVLLSKRGGALSTMLLPFRLGVGGKIGSGSQYFAYASLRDAVRAVIFCLDDQALSGPVNVVAPEAVTNQEFTRVLASALGRPSFMRVPAFALRLALGTKMAEQLLLQGQRVRPMQLQAQGFEWLDPSVESAVDAALAEDEPNTGD